jgi:hypothetical protein
MTHKHALTGVAHDIAHHAGSGLGWLCPHMAQALRGAGLSTASVDLLSASPYPAGAIDHSPLRTALQSLRSTAENILGKYGFSRKDVVSIELQATPAPWDDSGYTLHTRAVITAADGAVCDSGWLN